MPRMRSRQNATSALWQANTFYKAGQLVVSGGLVYTANADFTSGGAFNAANWTPATAGTELGYAENITGTALSLTTSYQDVSGCSVTLAQVARPQMVLLKFTIDVATVAATNAVGNVFWQVIDDASTVLDSGIGGTFESVTSGGSSFLTACAWCRIPANTAAHTYKLQIERAADSTFRANILNSNPFRSAIGAYLA